MIEFNRACVTGNELDFISRAIESKQLCGGGLFTRECEEWMSRWLVNDAHCLLTSSCTAALEIAALLVNIRPGDEVIMPSYTFVSTANAFVRCGAKIVFVDIRPDTMNIDETKIEQAITDHTKAIVVVHYAGVACNMRVVATLAQDYGLYLIEDAAQAIMSSYEKQPLGSFGHLSTFSFHETKNVTSGGEGGALIVNDSELVKRADIIRDKGTNRKAFSSGEVDKYSWVDVGSNYLMSELQAAYLYAQFLQIDKITQHRLDIWLRYYNGLKPLANKGLIELAMPPTECQHNAHIFYFKVKESLRAPLIECLKEKQVIVCFHYVPLHVSAAGKLYGRFVGDDGNTINLSDRIVRLPIWYPMGMELVDKVVNSVIEGVYKVYSVKE